MGKLHWKFLGNLYTSDHWIIISFRSKSLIFILKNMLLDTLSWQPTHFTSEGNTSYIMSWEGTQVSQLTQLDQRDISYRVSSVITKNTWKKHAKKVWSGVVIIHNVYLSGQPLCLLKPWFLGRAKHCLLMGNRE